MQLLAGKARQDFVKIVLKGHYRKHDFEISKARIHIYIDGNLRIMVPYTNALKILKRCNHEFNMQEVLISN